MANKQKKRFKWRTFSFLAYLFATAVGYLYATGYYGHFGIDILNYVEPIDFLLISLDNVNEVLAFSGLIVPFVLPSIILVLVGAVLLALIIVFASLAAYLSLVLTLCSSSLLTLAAIVALVRPVADRTKWAQKTLQATFGRQSRGGRTQVDAQGSEGRRVADRADFRRKIRRLVATYKDVAKAHPSKPAKESDYLNGAKEVTLEVPRVWSWIPQMLHPIRDRTRGWMGGFFESESSWRPKGWTSLGRLRQLVIVGLLAYIGGAAYVNGKVNAQIIRSLSSTEAIDTPKADRTWTIPPWTAICPVIPWSDCDQEDRPVTTYAVPTANLAALELNECKEQDVEGLRYARANLRQDVSGGIHGAASDCHVYLGATGSMQFLADFTSTDDEPNGDRRISERSEPVVVIISEDESHPATPLKVDDRSAVVFDARSGVLSTRMCELELVALVGPFVTGSADIERDVGVQWCDRAPGQSPTELMSVEAAVMKLEASTLDMLVLVGRADIRPINNSKFDSNSELIDDRLAAVSSELEVDKRLGVLSVPGGPMNWIRADDPCSRVVEIYGCPTSTDTGAGKAGTGGESQSEEVPSSKGVDNS